MKLTEEEITDRGRQLAGALRQIDEAEEAKRAHSTACSEGIKSLRARVATLADEIRTGRTEGEQPALPLGRGEEATL